MNHIGLWTTSHIPRGIHIIIPKDQHKIVWGDLLLLGRLTIRAGGTLVILNGTLVQEPGSLFTNEGTLVEYQIASQAELVSLDGRVGTVEGDVASLDGRVGTVEGDVASMDGRVDTLETDVPALDGRVTTVEGDLATEVSRLEGLINNSDVFSWATYSSWGRN